MHTRNTFPTTHIHRYAYRYPIPQHLCSSLGEICWLRTARETASSHSWRELSAFSPQALSPLASSHCFFPETSEMLGWGDQYGIFCPGCEQYLSKAHWRPCQWKANSASGGTPFGEVNYTMCRDCQPHERWRMDPEGRNEPRPTEQLVRLSAIVARGYGRHLE